MNSDTVAISRATTNLTTPILDSSYPDQEEVNFDPAVAASAVGSIVQDGSSDVPVAEASTSSTSLSDRSLPFYNDAFPALPASDFTPSPLGGQGSQIVNSASAAAALNNKMKVKSTTITSSYRLAPDNMRANLSDSSKSRSDTDWSRIKDIMSRTGTVIEKCSSKDGSLTFLITGKHDNVQAARRLLGAEMETQIEHRVHIPKAHHKVVLGKNGQKLKDLQNNTGAKVIVPDKLDESDAIRIIGTKAAIEKALHEIQVISSELASKNTEKLIVSKEYHPFINGPLGETVKKIMNDTGAKVNIPPLSVTSNEITISGETNAVAQAKEIISQLVKDKIRKCTVVHVEVKKQQHRYVIGPKGQVLQEILRQTGVSIEVPPTDNPSETITLRGEQEKLGPALTLLYEKAHSEIDEEIDAPSWLQKYIIGPKGSHFQEISQDFHSTVNVSFSAAENKIRIHGPVKDVEKARQVLENEIRRISRDVLVREMKVDAKYHKFLIGKSGQTINQIREKTGAQITIPTESEGLSNTNVIRIEGNASAVESAKIELEAIIKKRMETDSLVTQELNIEQRFHKLIIGVKGENIREIRERFNQVVITFPVSETKSDKVTVRGPKDDVDKCCKHLAQLNKELLTNNYRIEVPIFKQFHKFLIGKDGSNIKKIRDDTNTKIELPAEGSDSEVIVISGKKSNVEQAMERVQSFQNELINVVQVDMIIPAKFHNSIIGARGRQIRQIMDDCGGVQIKFPVEGSGSDKVSIRGPRDCVTKAKQALFELSSEMQVNSYTDEIKARPEHHKFLIGKSGSNIKKIRDSTGAKIFFPSEKDEASDTIVITGKKEAVVEARKELSTLIKELEKIVEDEVTVDSKHHKHFIARRAALLRQISDEFGGVQISLPRNSDRVILKGAKEFVSRAKQRILEEVERLDSLVSQEVTIDQVHHRAIMGSKGNNVKAIQAQHNVQIKFPDHRAGENATSKVNGGDHISTGGTNAGAHATAAGEQKQNGDANPTATHSDDASSEVSDVSTPRRQRKDVIIITGRPENCESAKVALQALIPIEVEVQVPYDYHRFIIGAKGKDVRELMDKFDVNIVVPHSSEQKDTIKLTGTRENTSKAAEAIESRVKQLDQEKEDREARSFKIELHVDPAIHPKIIGKKGTTISKIRGKHDVQIQFPERNSSNGEVDQTLITITGYENKALAARDEIMKLVGNIESLITRTITIDARVHPRLIGARGKNIRKIMDKFSVEIRFPRNGTSDPNVVTIIGQDADVDAAADHLKNLEDEYLEDEGTAYMPPVVKSTVDGETKQVPGYVVKGAPWDNQARPDTNDKVEFPSMGSNEVENGANSGALAWGPRQ